MINKIFKIKNYARFNNVNSTNMPDKGIMKRVNLIYAPNGTGKTSLSLIFQSLSTKNEKLILKKKSVLVEGELEVGAILDDKAEEFKRNQWTDNLHLHKEIKVFNSYFLNDNVYTFNLNDKNFSTRDFLL
ncbi:AAA family ATPase, partial [Lactiplantibacillus pentosus]